MSNHCHPGLALGIIRYTTQEFFGVEGDFLDVFFMSAVDCFARRASQAATILSPLINPLKSLPLVVSRMVAPAWNAPTAWR